MVTTTDRIKAIESRLTGLDARLTATEKELEARKEKLADLVEFWSGASAFVKVLVWIGRSTKAVFAWFIAFMAFLALLKTGALDWLGIIPTKGPEQ